MQQVYNMIETENNVELEDEVIEAAEYQRGISDDFLSVGTSSGASKLRIYCFACHRMEYHYSTLKGKSYHYLLVGLTFGLALIFGPYRCRCCGHRRFVRYNSLNPRFWLHRWKYSGKSTSSKRSSRSGSSKRRSRSSRYEEDVVELVDDSEDVTVQNGVSPSTNGSTHDPGRSNGSVTDPRRANDSRPTNDSPPTNDSEPIEIIDDGAEEQPRRRRRRRRRKLKTVPVVDSIRKAREERLAKELAKEQAEQYETSGEGDFSIDGLMGSFETTESKKARQEELAKKRAESPDPFAGNKPRRKSHRSMKRRGRKPKRRHAKKERLHGPTLYCFNCQQEVEHYHSFSGTGYYFFLFGVTFGLITILGPFRCSICSKKRLWCSNMLNPKFYVRNWLSNRGYGG